MGHKFGYYVINLSLGEVWNKTFTFWEHNKGIIQWESVSPNNLIRKLIINRGASMISWGEKYIMNFAYNPKDIHTYVSIEVSLAFGYGMQWLKPQGLMKQWALEMGTAPMKLIQNVDHNFDNIFNEIQNIKLQQPLESSTKVCARCGTKNDINNKFCIQCAARFENK
jgi:hypothetical protein